MKCNNIFIVAKISRAITDQSLKSSLYNVLAKHVPLAWEEAGGAGLNLAVVCTKSEDINLRAARTEFCRPGKAIEPQAMAALDDEIDAARTAGDERRKKDAKTTCVSRRARGALPVHPRTNSRAAGKHFC